MTASVISIIDATAQKYGVAPWIAEDIAKLESNDNPSAVGDHGTSFGLFQLHWGGQGTGYTAAQLEDPTLNADIGISHLSAAYQQGVSKGLSGFSLLDYVATKSGHPGYGGPGSYPSYEATLQRVFNSGSSTTTTPTTLAADFTPLSTVPKDGDMITAIDDMTKIEGGFSLLNPTANAKPVFFRVCIVLIGLICIIFGIFAIVVKVV